MLEETKKRKKCVNKSILICLDLPFGASSLHYFGSGASVDALGFLKLKAVKRFCRHAKYLDYPELVFSDMAPPFRNLFVPIWLTPVKFSQQFTHIR